MGSYFWCGLAGALVGALTIIIFASLSYTPRPTLLISIVAPPISLLLAIKLGHIVFGHERLVLYEMLLASLAGTAVVLHVFGQPIWSGLDLAILGIGGFLALGRIGCLRVGCCHGRPCPWGITYSAEHGRRGFPACYVGVRLMPVQALESLAHALLVTSALLVFRSPHAPGEITILYFTMYAPIRFALELLRGDAARPFLWSLSEAQWLALATAWISVYLAAREGIHHSEYHMASAVSVSAAALATLVIRLGARRQAWRVLAPARVRELAEALHALPAARAGRLTTIEMPSGLRLSFSVDEHQGQKIDHFGVSLSDGTMAPGTARALARLIQRLRRRDATFEITPGQEGMFHILFRRSDE